MSEKSKSNFASSLDSLRNAGCKLVNQHLPNYIEGADQAEIFGVTREQFERAFDLEWIRRGRPENAVVAALYVEAERLRGELSKIGVHIERACYGFSSKSEPPNLVNRLNMIRALAATIKQLRDDRDGLEEAVLYKPR